MTTARGAPGPARSGHPTPDQPRPGPCRGRRARIEGLLLGLAAGDAAGWPAARHRAARMPEWTRRLTRELDTFAEQNATTTLPVPIALNQPPEPLRLGPSDDAEWAAFAAEDRAARRRPVRCSAASAGTAGCGPPSTSPGTRWPREVAAAAARAPEVESARAPAARPDLRTGRARQPRRRAAAARHRPRQPALLRRRGLRTGLPCWPSSTPADPGPPPNSPSSTPATPRTATGCTAPVRWPPRSPLALGGADVDAAVDAALAQLPEGTEIGRNAAARRAARPRLRRRGRRRLRARTRPGTPDRRPRLQLRDRRGRDRPGRPGPGHRRPRRIAEAVPAAACLSRVADSAPALAGALTGALGGGAAVPAALARSLPHPRPAARCPGSRAPTSSNSPGCWKPRNQPLQRDDSGHDAHQRQEQPTALGLDDRITGALVGAAVGDALGGPVEGCTPEQIVERHGGRVHGIVGPWNGDDWRTARPIAPYHKGDGHVTDDTLMTHALVRVYGTVRDHLDAYAVADHLVPDLIGDPALDPGAGGRGAAPAADLPRREVDRGPAPLRPCRSARGRRRQHRQLRCGDVHGAGRPGQRGQPGGRVRRGAGRRGRPPVVVRQGGGGSLRGGSRRGVRAGCDARHSVVDACLSLAKDGTRAAIEAVCEVAVPAPGLRVGAGTAA